MKILMFILRIICRALAAVCMFTLVPLSIILLVIAVLMLFAIGLFEWIFTGGTLLYEKMLDIIGDNGWDIVMFIPRKLTDI